MPVRVLFSDTGTIENPEKAGIQAHLLYFPSGRYREKVFYYVYDFNDLFADVGGYLGLLLGHSILSFYDIAKCWTKKII